MKTIIAFVVLTIPFSICYSQSSPKSKLGAWYMLDATHIVSEKISFKTGMQLRSYEVLDNINLMLYYTGINYKLNKKTTITFSYSYLDIDKTYNTTRTPHLFENRLYEQICYNHTLTNLPVYHRLRLENRFLNYADKNIMKNRFRYCLGTKLKLNRRLFVCFNNEFFANLKGRVFTENRLYTALGIKLSTSENIQLGYLNHKINAKNLHRLQIGVFIKSDFRKKTKINS